MASPTKYRFLLVERSEDGVEVLTLNRPERMNACNGPMLVELREHFEALRYDLAVRVVLLRGAGKGFCTGMDMKEGAGMDQPKKQAPAGEPAAPKKPRPRPSVYAGNHAWSDVVRKMRACPQPIIALVHGYAMGGGFAIALGADIRLAAAGTKFNVQMIRIGMSGGDVGISYALPRAVGQSVAAELMLTGDFISAERGARVGLVSEVYADMPDMLQAAEAMAKRMVLANPDGLRFTKECLRLSVDAPSLEAAMAVEDRQQMLMAHLSSEHRSRVTDFAHHKETDAASASIFHDKPANPASKL
mmetsp:Transcript_57707/g.162746  ORF Transcript_57707/g.162746 Transcript_57707/m.162746 type:complete len:302 (+) Transcript_57707:70-975(+)